MNFFRSFRVASFRLWCRRLVLPLAAALGLAGCGGGSALGDTPAAWTATQALQSMTSAPRSYPAGLAVRVTSTSADVQVAGVGRLGGAPLQGNEAFPVGSLTKSMTATLAGLLVQEGRIAWNTRLLDAVPELGATARADYAKVTLTDLLAHRGGSFPATTPEQLAQLPTLSGTPLQQRLQLAAWLLQQPTSSVPGVKTQYSNGDYVLAGVMLERAGGLPYEALLQAKLFAPMGATVSFGAPGSGAGEPWGHMAGPGTRWQPVDPSQAGAQFPAYGHPAGGAKLPAAALARYLQMHLRALRGSTGELLTPATARSLHTVVQDGMALGWQQGTDLDGGPIQWHNGSDDASYYALMAIGLKADVASAVVVTGLDAGTEADVSAAASRMLR